LNRAEVTSPLPAPPADPLHILPAWSLLLLLAAVGLLLLALAWLIFRVLRRHQPPPAVEPPPAPRPAPARPDASSIATRIGDLENRFLESKAFREGCHALAGVVKAHLGRSSGLDAEHMTSSEIAAAVKDDRVGRFMTGLAGRRFGREEPRRRHFVAACQEAREVLG
jgi:hypothetical protein